MEAAAREPLGRACAAKMDYRGKLPLLLTAVFLNRKVTAILARPLKGAASVKLLWTGPLRRHIWNGDATMV